jgi:hypothetical protein
MGEEKAIEDIDDLGKARALACRYLEDESQEGMN